MRISQVSVSNFRAISEASIDLEPLTCIIGENNSGKSAFLKALDLFFQNAPKVEEDDFHHKGIETAIEITLTLVDLTPKENELFRANLIDGKLTVTRRLLHGNPKESGGFSVDALVNPAFSECRNEQGKTERREIYRRLQGRFPDLPNVGNADQIDERLEAWEAAHPEELTRQRVGSFRGWKNVAIGQLKARTDFVSVPAVRDALEETGEARSPARQLIDTVAKQTIENNREFQQFTAEANERLRVLTDPTNVPALTEISTSLSTILRQYYSNSELRATWDPIEQVPIQFPSSQIVVSDHNFTSSVERVGHGLQRAVIITVLEFLARQRTRDAERADAEQEEFSEPQSDLIIAIEEPEIYQHPTKQRHLSRVLCDLAGTFSRQTGIRIQIIMATHSPLFIQLPRFNEVRIARRVVADNSQVRISKLKIAECSAALAQCFIPPRAPLSDAAFAARLHVFTSEISEGFFARKVVLVEGPSDKAVLEAAFGLNGRSSISEGICIIDVGGKTKIDKPACIFRSLGIPTYVLFDNDQRVGAVRQPQEVQYNRFLQRVLGVDEANVTDWPAGINENWAAWDGNLENYIRTTSGQVQFDSAKNEVLTNFEVEADDYLKSPAIAKALLYRLTTSGIRFENLVRMIEMIDSI
jgi:predicted ATP-dependent endonuclease of OLD family